MEDKELTLLFREIDDTLNAAYETNDSDEIGKLLADEWLMLEPVMGLVDRDRFLKAISENRLVHIAMKKKIECVRRFGDVVIVMSRGSNIGSYDRQLFDTVTWVTNIYRRSASGWLCISTQEAPVACNDMTYSKME